LPHLPLSRHLSAQNEGYDGDDRSNGRDRTAIIFAKCSRPELPSLSRTVTARRVILKIAPSVHTIIVNAVDLRRGEAFIRQDISE
jgi:hypothetical protein